jgi:hypothetical protein
MIAGRMAGTFHLPWGLPRVLRINPVRGVIQHAQAPLKARQGGGLTAKEAVQIRKAHKADKVNGPTKITGPSDAMARLRRMILGEVELRNDEENGVIEAKKVIRATHDTSYDCKCFFCERIIVGQPSLARMNMHGKACPARTWEWSRLSNDAKSTASPEWRKAKHHPLRIHGGLLDKLDKARAASKVAKEEKIKADEQLRMYEDANKDRLRLGNAQQYRNVAEYGDK